MNDIPLHVLRIIASDEPPCGAPAAKHDAYEALARRHRSARQANHQATLPGPSTAETEGDQAERAAYPHSQAEDDACRTRARAALSGADGNFKRACPAPPKPALHDAAAAPSGNQAGRAAAEKLQQLMPAYVAALGERHHTALKLIDFLADRVADFCGDSAVLSQGDWQVTVLLDPAILPATKLQIRLSYFDLHLRFECRDSGEKQLILDHSGILKSRLEVLLASQGVTREIQILIVRSIAD
jgi:type III secretion control protein HpaP